MAYFPVFINLEAEKVLVVGGGRIATRRVGILLEFGASLTVVADRLSDEILMWEQQGLVTVFHRHFEEKDIKDQSIVLSATDHPQTEACVYRACREAGIPVNLASDRTKCDFYFPAVVRSGDMVIGLTSSGSDHKSVKSLAQSLRDYMSNDSNIEG